MKKKKLVLKKKLNPGEKAPDASAFVAPLEVHVTSPIPSGQVKFKKSEVENERLETDGGSDKAAAAVAKLEREREEAAVSERERRNAQGGDGKRGSWDFIDDFPGF